jgi:putative ABC transport system ATP-binding protein
VGITVEATNLSKVYREGSHEVVAVRGASFSAAAGEMVAIMGPSGSGKTTLLSMLGCILRPTGGSISVCGQRVDGLDETELPSIRRRYMGFIFQSFNLFAALTAAENVEMMLKLKGLDRPRARARARELLAIVGLAQHADVLPRDLSGGEKQRVSIARALAGDPPLILADEPTASLDWKNGEHVIQLLRDATRSGTRTVIVVTHDHRVDPFIDRSVNILDGELVA